MLMIKSLGNKSSPILIILFISFLDTLIKNNSILNYSRNMNIKNFISFIFLIQSTMTFPRRNRNRNGRENEIETTSSTTQSTTQSMSSTTQSTTQSMSSTTQSMSSTTHTCA